DKLVTGVQTCALPISGVVAQLAFVPCAFVGDLAVELFPAGDLLFIVDQGKNCARDYGYVGAADDLHQAEGMRNFFVAPLVAAYDGDAQRLNLGRLDKDEDGLMVGGGWPATVLINDDFPAASGLRVGGL